jgi:2-keto-4-pentenoate hydratase/2-oxohepta-3-ene-1,7-dioic acid hydratase in catechol pathway
MALPIDLPGKIICVGLNYQDHIAEQGEKPPEEPLLFAKWTNVLIGPGEPIVLPGPIDERIDYEGELGVIIGRRIKHVSRENALEAVRGYVCFNDVSARTLQATQNRWSRGKSPDTFGPVSAMTPASEIDDPHNLPIRTILNGETMQDSNTSAMIFRIDVLIEYITQTITLEPGDLLATGTPPGVGMSRKPPVFLKAGDEVTVEIDGVGRLTNPVSAPARAAGTA